MTALNLAFQNDWQLLLTGTDAYSDLLRTWVAIMLVTVAVCFVVGELTKNYSQVDKIWSLMPIVYAGVTLYAFPSSPRIWLMAVLVTLWGARLTYNFYRKGGYNIIPWKGEEDYRWEVLRQKPQLKGFRMVLFNLLFISFYQQALIILFTTPLLLAAKNQSAGLSTLDVVATVALLLLLYIETTADNQLFAFHQQKQNKAARDGRFSKSLEKGFMVDGLWKYVRHPNFAAEQSIWVVFYLFSVAASGEWINWSISGALLLIILFKGSSDFTESISAQKYTKYKTYQQSVPRFIPLTFCRKQDEEEKKRSIN